MFYNGRRTSLILPQSKNLMQSFFSTDMEFRQKELLPREVCDDSWKVYYIRILHNREKIFGYTVVQFENPLDGPDEFYHDWNLTLSQTINNLYATRSACALAILKCTKKRKPRR